MLFRSDGHLKAFKHGAFTLALRGRVPLLPIVVEGTANALPKRGFILQGRHAIRVRVLPEIPYSTFAGDSVEALTERVHTLFRRELGEPAVTVSTTPSPEAARAERV